MEAFPLRLRSARKMKGWSLQELADHLLIPISKQSLHKYEMGEMRPSGEVLLALSKALEVGPDQLFRSEAVELGNVEYRKRSRLSAKERDLVLEKVREFLERYIEVEQLLGIESGFKNPVAHLKVKKIEDVEFVALELIQEWNLGFDPIPNVLEMLEANGVRVLEIDAPEGFDGLSCYVGTLPVVVISKNFTVERKRFTALHELGHLLLNIQDDAIKEKICHAFAGALLLPDDSLNRLLGDKRSNIAMGELISIKEQFGISIQAIMMRAQMKGIVSPVFANRFWRLISKNKKEEGYGSFKGSEKSYRFEHLVFRLAAEEMVSMSKAANLAGLRLAEFRDKLEKGS